LGATGFETDAELPAALFALALDPPTPYSSKLILNSKIVSLQPSIQLIFNSIASIKRYIGNVSGALRVRRVGKEEIKQLRLTSNLNEFTTLQQPMSIRLVHTFQRREKIHRKFN
jgi:hypothetical protein